MEVVEIRDLDGPNLFRMEPAIKIGLLFGPGDPREQLLTAVTERIHLGHDFVGETRPRVLTHAMDHPDEVAVTFDWRWRRFAVGVARFASDLGHLPDDPAICDGLKARLEVDRQEEDGPLWVRDAERAVLAVGITGTNGKTTTTRLLAHIAMESGKHVGWSSSTGVYIDGRQVLEGDYSGPSGARRAMLEPGLDLAVLETARGGLLQRGLAYESNDVGVFLNVAADHLSLHGVETLETLAEVKGVVVRATKADGLVVLSADDPLVLAFRDRVRAPVLLITQQPEQKAVGDHINRGGRAVTREGEAIILHQAGTATKIADLADIPITFDGAAPFMVENAMAAAGAAIGVGFGLDEIARGLHTFRSDSESNKGRLNVFDVDGRTVVIDYAHNETGLLGLANFARSLVKRGCRLHLVIGTAGDRRDEDFLGLGGIARRCADNVYLKDTPAYLRGRKTGEMTAIMQRGFDESTGDAVFAGSFSDEMGAFVAALNGAAAGDVIAVMCQADQDLLIDEIHRRGGFERSGG